MPIYAECGGLMYLTEAIVDSEGHEHEMVGLLPGRSRMTPKLTLGYRQAEATTDGWLLRQGEAIRGHEFHYSIWNDRPAELPAALQLSSARWRRRIEAGRALASANLWASYVHLHFAARPELARRLVAAAGDWARSVASVPVERLSATVAGERP